MLPIQHLHTRCCWLNQINQSYITRNSLTQHGVSDIPLGDVLYMRNPETDACTVYKSHRLVVITFANMFHRWDASDTRTDRTTFKIMFARQILILQDPFHQNRCFKSSQTQRMLLQLHTLSHHGNYTPVSLTP